MILNTEERISLRNAVADASDMGIEGFECYRPDYGAGVRTNYTRYTGDFKNMVHVKFDDDFMDVCVLNEEVDNGIDGPWWDYLREQIPLLQAKADEVKRERMRQQEEDRKARKQRILKEHEELAKRFKEVMK